MTIMSKDFIKDPNAQKQYTLDGFTNYLAGATFTSKSWSVPAGITLIASDIDITNQYLLVTLSGGTLGTDYDCYVTFTTSDGRTDRAMLRMKIR